MSPEPDGGLRVPRPGPWFLGRGRSEGSGLEGFEGPQDWEKLGGSLGRAEFEEFPGQGIWQTMGRGVVGGSLDMGDYEGLMPVGG